MGFVGLIVSAWVAGAMKMAIRWSFKIGFVLLIITALTWSNDIRSLISAKPNDIAQHWKMLANDWASSTVNKAESSRNRKEDWTLYKVLNF
jgi:hypothetical protein